MKHAWLGALVVSFFLATGAAPAQGTAPEFTHIDRWINSPPLTMGALRGKVVPIDFWAYSCINSLRATRRTKLRIYQL